MPLDRSHAVCAECGWSYTGTDAARAYYAHIMTHADHDPEATTDEALSPRFSAAAPPIGPKPQILHSVAYVQGLTPADRRMLREAKISAPSLDPSL